MKMKGNTRFFAIVISLLLASTFVLAGCMVAVAADNGEMKPYDLGGQQSMSEADGKNDTVPTPGGTPDESDYPGPIVEDGPLAQSAMQEKYKAMYDISEDGKSITVITKDYLDDYWQSNYDKEVIRSLTTEEVYFIIQDSIRIYDEYDEVILSGFASTSSDSRIASRMPCVEDKVIDTRLNETLYYGYLYDDIDAIYEIILYRLKALSSPKAFFTGEEAMRFAGEEPGINSTMLPWTTFYIPNFSEMTDRDYILFVVGYGNKMNSEYDREIMSDLFSLCNKNDAYVFFNDYANGRDNKIFPTEEIYKQKYPFFTVNIPELNNALLEHRKDYKVYIDGDYLCGGGFGSCRNLILKDLTGDGKPEICFVMSVGSGMVELRISIYDYETRECIFSLSDRGKHDYTLFVRDGNLCVAEIDYNGYSENGLTLTRTGVLTYDGSKITVAWDAEVNFPCDLPTGIPIILSKPNLQ